MMIKQWCALAGIKAVAPNYTDGHRVPHRPAFAVKENADFIGGKGGGGICMLWWSSKKLLILLNLESFNILCDEMGGMHKAFKVQISMELPQKKKN